MSEAPTTIRGLLLARADDDAVGVRAGDHASTWREVVDHSRVRTGWMQSLRPRDATRRRVVVCDPDHLADAFATAGRTHLLPGASS